MRHRRSLVDPYRFARFDDPDVDEGTSLVDILTAVVVAILVGFAVFGIIHT